jgi:hypothetical protein
LLKRGKECLQLIKWFEKEGKGSSVRLLPLLLRDPLKKEGFVFGFTQPLPRNLIPLFEKLLG